MTWQSPLFIANFGSLADFLVNVFPALLYVPDWFPGTSWKQTARRWREQKDRAVETAYGWATAQIVSEDRQFLNVV
jgi:hypothetical protein